MRIAVMELGLRTSCFILSSLLASVAAISLQTSEENSGLELTTGKGKRDEKG
jgi:hypothetical protein